MAAARVAGVRVPDADAVFVSTWDLVAEAASRVEDFSNRFRHALFSQDDGTVGVLGLGPGGAPDVFASADPPELTVHRKIFFSELTQKKMELLDDDISPLADELIDRLLKHDHADAAAGLANPLPIRVITERVIGFRDPNVAQMQRWVFGGSRLMGGRLRLNEMAAVGKEMGAMLPCVAGQLKAALASSGRGDVLSAAATGVRDGVMSREEATFTLMVLIGAGGETTTSLIGNAIRILAERPSLQDSLRAHPDLVPALVEEVLRFETPFRFHPRTARRAVEFGGVEIPKGAMVALLWGAANRDASVFEQPDDVVLDRPNAPLHFGFGRGIHHGVGAPLARLEARVVLTKLLERTTQFRLDPDRSPRWTENLWARRHEHLPLVLQSA